MRRTAHALVLALVCALACPHQAHAAATFVAGQIATGNTGLGSSAVTGTGGTAFPGATTAGNTLIAFASWDDFAQTGSLSGCGTWSTAVPRIQHATQGGGNLQAFKAFNIPGGSCNVTLTLTGSAFGLNVIVIEVTGVPTTDPQDTGVISTDNAEAGTAVDLPNLTSSANGSIYIAAFCDVNDDAPTWTTTGSSPAFTERADFHGCEVATLEQGTAAAVTPAATLTVADNAQGMALALLASGGGGGGGVSRNPMTHMGR